MFEILNELIISILRGNKFAIVGLFYDNGFQVIKIYEPDETLNVSLIENIEVAVVIPTESKPTNQLVLPSYDAEGILEADYEIRIPIVAKGINTEKVVEASV